MIVWRVPTTSLNRVFLRDVQQFLGESPYTWYVVSGYRSLKDQQLLYDKYKAGGPKAAPPGKSAHNYGKAIDVVLDADPDQPGLQPSWNTKLAGWVWLKAKSIAHPRLKGGWSFSDWPHLEKFRWQDDKP